MSDSFVEKISIPFCGRKKLHVLESADIHSQATRIFKKQSWMRASGDQTTGLFLIEIFRQAAADLRNRAAHIGPAHHDRKVPNIGRVLLFKMKMEPFLGNLAGRSEERRVGKECRAGRSPKRAK